MSKTQSADVFFKITDRANRPLGGRFHTALTLNRACRGCWDFVDLGSRQGQLVPLKLEGDRFAALTGRHRSASQGGQLGDTHDLTG